MFQGTWGGKLSPKTPINPPGKRSFFFLYIDRHYSVIMEQGNAYHDDEVLWLSDRFLDNGDLWHPGTSYLRFWRQRSVFGFDLITCWKTNMTSELYYQTLIHGAVPIVNNTNFMLCYKGNKRKNFWHKWTKQISCVQCFHPAGNQDILLTIRKPLDPVTSVTNLMLCQLTRRVLRVCCTETHWWQPNVSVMCMYIPLGIVINSFWKQDSSKMDYTETRQVRNIFLACKSMSQCHVKVRWSPPVNSNFLAFIKKILCVETDV